MKFARNLKDAIEFLRQKLIHEGRVIHTDTWQAMEIKDKKEMAMWEALFLSFKSPIPNDVLELKDLVKPNLPWADVHFKERVSGKPLNPGDSYKIWPFYRNDKAVRNHTSILDDRKSAPKQFSHTYMERFWPKYANLNEGSINQGIRYNYGDINSVIRLLVKDPLTRQAYLPIFFPEDTGAEANQRVPCTLGYHFLLREGYLHITYHIRSCDFQRHLRDDIYLACLLLYWVIQQCQQGSPSWNNVKPGYLIMNITSLHIFNQERKIVERGIDDSRNINNY